MTNDETVKTTLTLPETSESWLLEEYHEALNLQEAVRMAIADARYLRDGPNSEGD